MMLVGSPLYFSGFVGRNLPFWAILVFTAKYGVMVSVASNPEYSGYVSSSTLDLWNLPSDAGQLAYSGMSKAVSVANAALSGVFNGASSPNISGALGTDPGAALAGYMKDNSGTSQLAFPPDTPPYYFRIDMSAYDRKSWLDFGQLSLQETIILSIPHGLIDAHEVTWNGEEIGAIPGSLLLGGGIGAGAGAPARMAAQAIAEAGGGFGSGVLNAMEFKYGVAINNYISMMLKGPTYKTHTFTWKFSPENQKESETVAAIYRVVNAAQAPSLADLGSTGSAFFRYPSIFQLAFCHSGDSNLAHLGQMLYQFKPCVLTESAWNFAPEGLPSFYAGSHAPQTVAVQMSFTELEYWFAQDYVNLATTNSMMQPTTQTSTSNPIVIHR